MCNLVDKKKGNNCFERGSFGIQGLSCTKRDLISNDNPEAARLSQLHEREINRVKEMGQCKGINQKGGMARVFFALFSSSSSFLALSRFAVQYLRKRLLFGFFSRKNDPALPVNYAVKWHLCRVVGFRETSTRFSTTHHRRPCRPSQSIRSKARGEQCASARIWCREQGSWLGFGLRPRLLRHCLRLRMERS